MNGDGAIQYTKGLASTVPRIRPARTYGSGRALYFGRPTGLSGIRLLSFGNACRFLRVFAVASCVAAGFGVRVPVAEAAAPLVVSSTPADQSVGVALDANVRVRVAGVISPASVTADHVYLRGSLQGPIPAAVTYNFFDDEIVVNPSRDFLPGERVILQVTQGVVSSLGEPLAGGHRVEFAAKTLPVSGGEFVASAGSWPIGAIAFNMTAGDLDGDGLPEVMYSNVVPDSLTILTPDGAGGFTLFDQVFAGILPRHTAFGDVTGNGWPDLVVCASGPNQIQVFPNLGNGVLGSRVNWETGETPYGAFLGDFDADGDLDVATANFNGHSVTVMLNDGAGNFATPAEYFAGAGADSPRWVDGADLDGDGDIDLACCNGYSYDVSVFLNDGDGTFTIPTALYPVGDSPQLIELRDFNGDGIADIVTVNSVEATISVLLGNGDGTFQPSLPAPAAGGQFPHGLSVIDLDGDDDLDVIVPVRGADAWQPFYNDGAGVLAAGDLYAGGLHCHTLAAADWDGDGDIDVVGGYAISQEMFLYTQAAAPAIVGTTPVHSATGVSVTAPIELQFSTDLDPASLDPLGFVVNGSQSGPRTVDMVWDAVTKKVSLTPQTPFLPGEVVRVTVTGTGVVNSNVGLPYGGWSLEFMTEGASSISFATGPGIDLPGSDPVALASSDFDGDGRGDLAVVNFLSNDVTILLSDGGLPRVDASVPVASGPVSVWAGDLDADGLVDLAVANLISSSITLLRNDGAGNFSTFGTLSTPGAPFSLEGADYDRDGDRDLAVAELDPDVVRIFWNDGTGAFPNSETIPTLGVPIDLAVTDCDNDGDLDLFVVDSGNSQVEVLRRTENGFESTGAYATGSTPVRVFPWDTNGDGWMDLVSADYGGGGVSVIENQGDGTYGPASTLLANSLPHGVWGADLTDDGQIELVTANSGASSVSIFRNLGGGAFEPPQNVPVGDTPYALVGGDWNGDGAVDLAAVNRTSGDLSLILNGVTTDVTPSERAPAVTRITGAHPNPFRADVRIDLAVAQRGRAVVRVFDVRGRLVASLLDRDLAPGSHRLEWRGETDGGRMAAAGVYFLRLDADGRSTTRKILRVR